MNRPAFSTEIRSFATAMTTKKLLGCDLPQWAVCETKDRCFPAVNSNRLCGRQPFIARLILVADSSRVEVDNSAAD